MTKKQTAVEFILNNVHLKNTLYWHHLVEQAKKIEKEQIIDAFGVGSQLESPKLVGYHDRAEQYYNENYGNF